MLREDLQTVWIHDGVNAFGGGNNNILVHTGQGEDYLNNGIMDETLMHEACHTSLDSRVYNTDGWDAAVAQDGIYISDYARDNPQREDVAETFLVWFATRYSQDTFTQSELDDWESQLGGRFAYFDDLCLEMNPYEDICNASIMLTSAYLVIVAMTLMAHTF